MKRKMSAGGRAFVAVMLGFSLFLAAHVILRAQVDFTLEDTARSLETSQGRERKQQYEYDQVVEELPKTRAELEEIAPKAAEAAETVKQLKEERKRLRAEKKALEAQKEAAQTEENPEE